MEKKGAGSPKPLHCRNDNTKALHELLGKVGDKWSILTVVVLSRSPGRRARFSGLRKQLEGISQRMLTTTLRDLERDGFVTREVFPEVPPRVEYELTPLGASLLGSLEPFVQWIIENLGVVEAARETFDKRG
jgi:DNA-binding HxlR family transcriptional regulator